MRWTIVWEPAAAREFDRLAVAMQDRIDAALSRLAITGLGNLRRLEGTASKELRLRVGKYRIRLIEEPDTGTLRILHIGLRNHIYD